ncbi:MAG: homoserine kinase [Allobaculum sp.]|nr:homoserine kinase [Allobaculum sp.]
MITIQVPATSANCSIGFDFLGLALSWTSHISFELAESFSITGCPKAYQGVDNLVYQSFVATCQKANVEVPPLHIHIDSDIPFARGLGSSSQCIAAGICGANTLLNLGLSEKEKLDIAVEIEGHPDNVAPALFGGLCACVPTANQDQFIRIKLGANDWKALLVIPETEIATKEARRVLPATLPLKDAALQAGRSFLFSYAWQQRDEALLYEMCVDKIHEPYRAKLIAQYQALKALADRHNVPFWISGSGSTMAFVSQREDILTTLKDQIAKDFPTLQLRLAQVSDTGAEVI